MPNKVGDESNDAWIDDLIVRHPHLYGDIPFNDRAHKVRFFNAIKNMLSTPPGTKPAQPEGQKTRAGKTAQ